MTERPYIGRRCFARFRRHSGDVVRCPFVAHEVIGHEALCHFHALERRRELDDVALCQSVDLRTALAALLDDLVARCAPEQIAAVDRVLAEKLARIEALDRGAGASAGVGC